jgi:IS5 family transposase
MFKCLLLQQWYTLSDPQLEEALTEHREQLEKSGQDCWAARQS